MKQDANALLSAGTVQYTGCCGELDIFVSNFICGFEGRFFGVAQVVDGGGLFLTFWMVKRRVSSRAGSFFFFYTFFVKKKTSEKIVKNSAISNQSKRKKKKKRILPVFVTCPTRGRSFRGLVFTSPDFFRRRSGGSQKPQLDIEQYQIHRNTLYCFEVRNLVSVHVPDFCRGSSGDFTSFSSWIQCTQVGLHLENVFPCMLWPCR